MAKASYGTRLPRLAAGVSLGLLMATSGYSAAAAGEVTPSSVNGVQHFFDCFGVLLHDGQAHQQYCSPGNAAGPGNSSLGSFSGGAVTCSEITGSLTAPAFKPFEVASIGDDLFETTPALIVLHMAILVRCDDCSSLDAPVFQTYQTASLDDSIGRERQVPRLGQNVQHIACV